MTRIFSLLAILLLGIAGTALAAPLDNKDGFWSEWSEATFERAAHEKKFVIVSLQSWWCPWCLTMNKETWADPEVRAELKDHFIPVHVDQDSRPDISQRYERWGWPATIIFGPDGTRDREAARLLFAEVLHPGAEGDGEGSLAGRLRRARRPGARSHPGDRPDRRAAQRHPRLHEQGLRPGQRRLEQEQAGRRADARLVPRSRQGRRRGGGRARSSAR